MAKGLSKICPECNEPGEIEKDIRSNCRIKLISALAECDAAPGTAFVRYRCQDGFYCQNTDRKKFPAIFEPGKALKKMVIIRYMLESFYPTAFISTRIADTVRTKTSGTTVHNDDIGLLKLASILKVKETNPSLTNVLFITAGPNLHPDAVDIGFKMGTKLLLIFYNNYKGQRVAEFVNQYHKIPGTHTINRPPTAPPSGIYFLNLKSNYNAAVAKVVIHLLSIGNDKKLNDARSNK